MTMEPQEILLIGRAVPRAAQPQGTDLKVKSRFPPRILVVEASTVPALEWVAEQFHLVTASGDAPDDLSDAERLFVNGWLTRNDSKQRLGDGETWDSPGRQPPDRPSAGAGDD